MNNRLIIVFLIIILFSSFLHAQTAEESPWSNCDFSQKTRKKILDWLNKTMNEVKKAVKDGRIYDNGNHKLPTCKIEEIESLYKNLIDAKFGTNLELIGRLFVSASLSV